MTRIMSRNENIFYLLSVLITFSLFFSNAAPEVPITLLNIHFLYTCYKEKNWHWLKEPLFITAMVFIAYACARSLLAGSGGKSFTCINLIRYYLIGLSMRQFLTSEKVITKFIYLNLIVLMFACLSALLQFIVGYDFFGNQMFDSARLTNFAGKLRIGAVLAFLSLPIAFALLKIQQYRCLNIIAIFTIWLTIFASGERSAFLLFSSGLVLGMLIIAEQRKRILIILIPAILLFVAVSLLKPEIVQRYYGHTYEIVSNYESSEYGEVHRNSLFVALQNPLFGVGASNYRNYCQDMDLKNGRCNIHAHNIYLEIASEFGAIGFLLLAYYFFILFKNINFKKLDSSLSSYFLVGAISLIVIKLIPLVPSSSIFRPWVNFSLFTYAAYLYNNRSINK
jgi:O-antigen ligase